MPEKQLEFPFMQVPKESRLLDILTYDPNKHKRVKAGRYDQTRHIFHRDVTAKHFMKISQSYGIQEDTFCELLSFGCEWIYMHTPTATLKSKFIDWMADDIRVQDFGHGRQRFFPVKRMVKI